MLHNPGELALKGFTFRRQEGWDSRNFTFKGLMQLSQYHPDNHPLLGSADLGVNYFC